MPKRKRAPAKRKVVARKPAPRKPAPKRAPAKKKAVQRQKAVFRTASKPKAKPAAKKSAAKNASQRSASKRVLKSKAYQKQVKKRHANIVKTGQAKGKAAVALARKRAQQSATKIVAKQQKANVKARKSGGATPKVNKQGFTRKQSAQVKKRTKNILKTGQASGKAAVKLARERTRASMQKTAAKKPGGNVAKQLNTTNGKKAKGTDAINQKTVDEAVKKEAFGFGRINNPNDPRLRFARVKGAKRKLL